MSLEELKEILNYDPVTGVVSWKVTMGNRGQYKAGTPCSNKDAYGYGRVKLKGIAYKLHRIAWGFVYGYLPTKHIDHIDGNPSNNIINNLREVSCRDNCLNRKIHRKGHITGTTLSSKSDKWQAQISIRGKRIYIGYFDTQQEAHEAYVATRNRLTEQGIIE